MNARAIGIQHRWLGGAPSWIARFAALVIILAWAPAYAAVTIDVTASAGGAVYPSGKVSVDAGSSPKFLAVANSGYSIREVKVNGISVEAEPLITLHDVTANTKLAITFVKNPNVTAKAGAGGTIAPAGTTEISYGASAAFTITPASGYEISGVKVFGKAVPIQSQITLPSVTGSGTVEASFKMLAGHLLITASAGTGGTITPSGKVSAPSGGATTFAIIPTAGFRITDVKFNGKSVGPVASYTIEGLQKNATIAASFAALPVIKVTQATGGAISPAGPVTVPYGGSQTFSISAAPGYTLDSLSVNGKKITPATSYTFSNVIGNGSLSAAFKLSSNQVVIKSSATTGGSISPSGSVAVTSGGAATFAIQANAGYQIDRVLVNGKSVGAVSSYTATDVTKPGTIVASFKLIGHVITSSSPPAGKIVPAGNVTVPHGKTQPFTVIPPKGFKAGLLVDGILAAQNPTGRTLVFNLANVIANHEVKAVYAPIGSQFAGTLTIGLVGLGERIFVANSTPGAFDLFVEGTLGVKSLQVFSERANRWFPVTQDSSGGTADVPFLEGDNPLWFAAIANDDSLVWYPTTVTYYPNLDFTTPLTPSVDTVTPAQPTTIRWTAGLLNAAGATVNLYSERAGGTRELVAQMRDNGVLPDEIDGDGVFSAQISVTAPTEGYLYYRAGVEKDGAHPYFSELARIWSANPVTDEEVTDAVEKAGDSKLAYDASIAAGKTPQQAAQETVAALKEDPLIGIAGATEDGSVWWMTRDGVLGVYSPSFEGQLNGDFVPVTGAVSRGEKPALMQPWNSGSPNYYQREDWSSLFSHLSQRLDKDGAAVESNALSLAVDASATAAGENRVGSDRAINISPYYASLGQYDGYTRPWSTTIKNRTACGLYGSAEKISNIALNDFTDLGDYGFVLLYTHGDNYYNGLLSIWDDVWGPNFMKGNLSIVGIYTGISLPSNLDDSWGPGSYAEDIKEKRIAVGVNGHIVLLPSFFRKYLPALPHSLVALAACRSGYNGSLSKEFIAKGASGVIGYTDYVLATYAQDTLQEILDRLFEDKTLEEAVQSARSKFGDDDGDSTPAALVYFGDGDLKFPLTSLQNGGFEDGVLTPWAKNGDGRVLTALGSTRPTEGTHMGIISTGLGYTTSNGSIEQRMCVPQGGGDLKLDWDFFSEEWLEWVGSIYQDTFQVDVAIVDPNTGVRGPWQSLFSRTINSLAGEVHPSDIGFDQGDVYDTGWRTTTLNLDGFAGKTLFLRLYSTDVGDSIYDSAILLDGISFTPRSTP